jgi:NADH dehydrogenase
MPGFKRRLRLMADWTVGLLFGRDASELGQLGHPPRLEEPVPASPPSDDDEAAAQPERRFGMQVR